MQQMNDAEQHVQTMFSTFGVQKLVSVVHPVIINHTGMHPKTGLWRQY